MGHPRLKASSHLILLIQVVMFPTRFRVCSCCMTQFLDVSLLSCFSLFFPVCFLSFALFFLPDNSTCMLLSYCFLNYQLCVVQVPSTHHHAPRFSQGLRRSGMHFGLCLPTAIVSSGGPSQSSKTSTRQQVCWKNGEESKTEESTQKPGWNFVEKHRREHEA